MLVLGIESSCDETAAAVVRDGQEILSSIVASQDDIHGKFGGVVPELASRKHMISMLDVTQEALRKAQVELDDINAIAVTRGPGLVGSLLIGLSFGKALAYAKKIPFVGVHHIEGHMAAALLGNHHPTFPIVGLVCSGGHTDLYRIEKDRKFTLLGRTMDDAAGEAFDKVGKILGLPYPGGPSIEIASEGGNPRAIAFPRPAMQSKDFSFSGLKTAVAVWLKKNGMPTGQDLKDVAASFQEAVGDVLVRKLMDAADRERVTEIAVCGGVAKNKRLRHMLDEQAQQRGLKLMIAPLNLCTDNAAMIAAAAYSRLSEGSFDDLSLNAVATIPITQ